MSTLRSGYIDHKLCKARQSCREPLVETHSQKRHAFSAKHKNREVLNYDGIPSFSQQNFVASIFTIVFALMQSIGCRPAHTKPSSMPPVNTSLAEIWCEKGVTAMCIDYHHDLVTRDSSRVESIKALTTFCEEGHGSACLYVAPFLGRRALKRACELNEARACHDEARTWMSNTSEKFCAAPSKATSSQNAAAARMTQTLGKDDIRRTVSQADDALIYCMHRKTNGLPEHLAQQMKGTLIVSILVNIDEFLPDSSEWTCSDFIDEEIPRCLAEVISTLKFKNEKGQPTNIMTRINYPFTFN